MAERLTETEQAVLIKGLQAMVTNEPIPDEAVDGQIGDWIRDFFLGLSFPQAVDVGEPGTKRRHAFITMSIQWHSQRESTLLSIASRLPSSSDENMGFPFQLS